MAKPTVYLDTSVISFLYADDAPEKKEITVDFFDNFVKLSIYDAFITEYVVREILNTHDQADRNRLLNVIEDSPIRVLSIDDFDEEEVKNLANEYLSSRILPSKNIYDALHVACTIVEKTDYLVSWNYRHLANINKERRLSEKNHKLGYSHPLRIVTPIELIGYGN